MRKNSSRAPLQIAESPAMWPAINHMSVGRRLAGAIDHLIFGGVLITVLVAPVQSFAIEFLLVMSVTLLFLWGLQAALRGHLRLVWNPVYSWLIAFLLLVLTQLVPLPWRRAPLPDVAGLSEMWSPLSMSPATTAQAAITLAALLALLMVATHVATTVQRLRRLTAWLIFLGCFLSLIGVVDTFSVEGEPLISGRSNPLGLSFPSLTSLVGLIELIFPLALATASSSAVELDQRVMSGLAAMAMGVAIVLANATGAIFVLLVAVLAWMWLMAQRRAESGRGHLSTAGLGRLWLGMAGIILMIVVGVSLLATDSIPQQIRSDVSSEMQSLVGGGFNPTPSHQSRIQTWKNSWTMVTDYPLFGVGVGAYPVAYSRYDTGAGHVIMNAAHNDYLQVVCETGVVGASLLLVFLIALSQLCRRALRCREPRLWHIAGGATVGCIAILVHSLVDFYLQQPATGLVFFLLLALLVGIGRFELSTSANGEPIGMQQPR